MHIARIYQIDAVNRNLRRAGAFHWGTDVEQHAFLQISVGENYLALWWQVFGVSVRGVYLVRGMIQSSSGGLWMGWETQNYQQMAAARRVTIH